MKSLNYFLLLCYAFFLLLPSHAAPPRSIEYIDSKSDGTSMAVVLDPAPLAHTTQVLPVNKDGEIFGKDDLTKQTEKVLDNLSSALKSGGSALQKAVKINVYIKNSELTPGVLKIFSKKFNQQTKPAVAFVAGELPHPDALVAMDAVGISTLSGSDNSVRRSYSIPLGGSVSAAHVAVLPENGAVYVAGMAEKGELGEATRKTLEKLVNTIGHLGLQKKDIVQLKAFLSPMSQLSAVRTEVARFFDGEMVPPVVYVDWVASSVPIEIELIAAAPSGGKKSEVIEYVTPPGTTASPVYSRIARVYSGKRVYISGLYGESTPEEDVKEIYGQLGNLLKKTGSDMNHLAKATYYFSDPKSNGRLDAFRPTVYDPKRPPAASKARVKDVGLAGKGITIDMIAVAPGK